MLKINLFFLNLRARVQHSRTSEDMFEQRADSDLPEDSMGEITNPVKRAPRGCASACETSVEGTLRRAPVPDRASRDTSLRVAGTLRDKVAHDHLLE